MNRVAFARAALAHIPKLLTLQDRNPHSPTYGCFDRNFWHYKIIDFPSGMAQEFVWPLALAMTTDLEANPYHRAAALREWVEAGILFAARSAHRDGSCDDYFPYERAGGAAAFSLLACVESYALLDLHNTEMLAFFRKRANWLANHHESGQLANHQALIALCLVRVGRLLDTREWDEARDQRLARVLSWQDEEGWFQEYEGCDTGYHTLTIGLLAQLHESTPREDLKQAIGKAVRFVSHFIHPDGSFGGEYSSRNTYNFFPHGFEIASRWMHEARDINDRFLGGLARGLDACPADDHIVGHSLWSCLLAWRYSTSDTDIDTPAPQRADGRFHFPNAGLLVERRNGAELYLALNKGSTFKFFRDGKLVVSDTQISIQIGAKRQRTAVAHLIDDYAWELGENEIVVRGTCHWAMQKQMTSSSLIALRILMFSIGKYAPTLIRKALQKLLITGKRVAPFEFTRRVSWSDDKLRVSDEVTARSWAGVSAVGIGASQTSIYVAMSRTFQRGQMQEWHDLTDAVRLLSRGQTLKVERNF